MAKVTLIGSMRANTYTLSSGNTYLLFDGQPTKLNSLADAKEFMKKGDCFKVDLSRVEKVKMGLAKPEKKKKVK